MKRLSEKQVGDTLYTFTRAFREGAWDYWHSRPYHNPYRDGSQRADDWEYGNGLASEGEVTKAEVGPDPYAPVLAAPQVRKRKALVRRNLRHRP